MESYHLDFDCVGIDDGGIIPIENTARGQDRSPEFLLWNLSPMPPPWPLPLRT